jgi:hypothetical protein
MPLNLAAHCQVGSQYSQGWLFNLSRSGMGLRTETAWPRGTAVRVAMALPYTEGPKFCTLSGTVVRSTQDHVGMQLDSTVGRTDRELLHGFIVLMQMKRQQRL